MFLTDEHVPRIFITTLRSSGHEVQTVKDVLGEGTDDEALLRYCSNHDTVLITHDKKDFSGDLAGRIDHPGIDIYTDANRLRDEPAVAVHTLERVFDHVPSSALKNEIVWLDEWRLG